MTKHSSLYLQLKKIIQCELELFPQAGAQDLAKLLYQAVYGPQHAVLAPEKLYDWLNQEMQALNPHPSEPLLQPVWLHYPMFRLHLSAAAYCKFDIEEIHHLFLQSCLEEVPLCPVSWQEIINDASQILAQELSIPTNKELSMELHSFNLLPPQAVHHTPHYNELYHPHYRMVSLCAIKSLGNIDSPVFIEAQSYMIAK